MTIAYAWKTPLGLICLIGQEEWLERIVVGHEEFAEVVRAVREYDAELLDQPPNSLWKECKRQLTAYAAGNEADFSQFPLNLSYLGPFQAKVVAVCRRVPRGKVLSYQQLAAKAGSPRAYRAAGTTMSSNRFPIVIPCHRIVATSGLGGYSGPTGLDFKRKLLELEEVDLESLKKPVKKGKRTVGK